jgi:hypothetical protein
MEPKMLGAARFGTFRAEIPGRATGEARSDAALGAASGVFGRAEGMESLFYVAPAAADTTISTADTTIPSVNTAAALADTTIPFADAKWARDDGAEALVDTTKALAEIMFW